MKIRLENSSEFISRIWAYGYAAECSWWAVYMSGAKSIRLLIQPSVEVYMLVGEGGLYQFRYPHNEGRHGYLTALESRHSTTTGYPYWLHETLYTQFSSTAMKHHATNTWKTYYSVDRQWKPRQAALGSANGNLFINEEDMLEFCIEAAQYLCNEIFDTVLEEGLWRV